MAQVEIYTTPTCPYCQAAKTLLTRKGVKHHVLNAKFHASEAQIVAQAGRLEFEAVILMASLRAHARARSPMPRPTRRRRLSRRRLSSMPFAPASTMEPTRASVPPRRRLIRRRLHTTP